MMSQFKSFGKNPKGAKQEVIQRSTNYNNKGFRNISETVMMAENASMPAMIWRFMNKPKNTIPPAPLPSVKTDLNSLSSGNPVIVWFGHSSYFIRIHGKNILVDPVLSGSASPFSFGAKSFAGSDVYTTDDFPVIDLLILTHDHYDHLDYSTVLKLKGKTKQISTSLGVGAHLTYWGFDENIITEFDWWDSKKIFVDMELSAAPARHFSGRSLVRNKTLWSSFILKTPDYKIYLGGDSGYDFHFKTIGERSGPFDIAILESGQYNTDWPQIHMMPEQTVQASIDLKAKVLLPVHWGKFTLALHPWDEPIKRILAKARELSVNVTTPLIGESVILNSSYPQTKWWERV